MKLRNKLIMSGVALAACAATLTSTTFAWYTTNTEVSATGISGAALESGASSIYISLDGKNWGQSVDLSAVLANNNGLVPVALDGNNNFRLLDNTASTAAFMGANAGADAVVTFTLYFKTAKTNNDVPIYYKDLSLSNTKEAAEVDNLLYNKNYTKIAVGTAYSKYSSTATYYTFTPAKYTLWTPSTGEEVGTAEAQFTSLDKTNLYLVKQGTTSYVKYNAETDSTYSSTTKYYQKDSNSDKYTPVTAGTYNEESKWTAALKAGLYSQAASQTDSTLGAGVDRNSSSYYVDFIKALCMKTVVGGTTTTAYDLKSFTTSAKGDAHVSMSDGQNGALNYYNEVMETTVSKPDTVTSETTSDDKAKTLAALGTISTSGSRTELCTLPANGNSVAVTFTIFLNGWDEYCYDVCKGQTFSMTMDFTSKPSE